MRCGAVGRSVDARCKMPRGVDAVGRPRASRQFFLFYICVYIFYIIYYIIFILYIILKVYFMII